MNSVRCFSPIAPTPRSCYHTFMTMTTEPPKRRWFQIRLSTCLLLMIATGALQGLNLFRSVTHFELEVYRSSFNDDTQSVENADGNLIRIEGTSTVSCARNRFQDLGWPNRLLTIRTPGRPRKERVENWPLDRMTQKAKILAGMDADPFIKDLNTRSTWEWHWRGIISNIGLGIVALLPIWLVSGFIWEISRVVIIKVKERGSKRT